MIKLNLGCGMDIRAGYTNIDTVHLEGVDLVRDLNEPLPYEDDSVDEILMYDIIEHLNEPMDILRECWRVLKEGCKLYITVVYYSHRYAWGDPQHKRAFSEVYFEHFVKGKQRDYYFDYHFSDLDVVFHYDGDNIQGMVVTLTK